MSSAALHRSYSFSSDCQRPNSRRRQCSHAPSRRCPSSSIDIHEPGRTSRRSVFNRSPCMSGYMSSSSSVAGNSQNSSISKLSKMPREVVRMPTPPPIVKRIVERVPTPEAYVIERVIVRPAARRILERIIERPRTPPPRIVHKEVSEPAPPPIVRTRVVKVDNWNRNSSFNNYPADNNDQRMMGYSGSMSFHSSLCDYTNRKCYSHRRESAPYISSCRHRYSPSDHFQTPEQHHFSPTHIYGNHNMHHQQQLGFSHQHQNPMIPMYEQQQQQRQHHYFHQQPHPMYNSYLGYNNNNVPGYYNGAENTTGAYPWQPMNLAYNQGMAYMPYHYPPQQCPYSQSINA